MGGLLFDLFRDRFLPQFLLVCIRRRAYGQAASAAFSWAHRRGAFARGRRAGSAWTVHSWSRSACRRRTCGDGPPAAVWRSFSIQLRHADGVSGLVWRDGIFADALLRLVGWLWITGVGY